MKTALRACLVLAVAVLLSTPATLARGPAHSRPAATWSAGVRAWSWLAQLWAKGRCGIDPNGLTCPASDAGGCIDPNGCAASAVTAPTPDSDARCGIDPNGLFCADPGNH